MTDNWAAQLARAMQHDDPGVNGAAPAESDPGPGPWDAARDAVADHVIAAAALGYPTDADADAILVSDPARQRLMRRWASAPPSDALVARAVDNPALMRLLRACGPDGVLRSGAARAAPHSRTAEQEGQRQRLRSLPGDAFTLAAADVAGTRHVQTWSGGRIVRQRLTDGTTAVTAEYTGAGEHAADADDPWVLALSGPTHQDRPLLLLLLLDDPTEDRQPGERRDLVGHAVIASAAAVGELQVSGPERLSQLSDAGLRAVSDSVAWSRGPWSTAWRRAAQAAGKGTPLHDAVLRGVRQP